MWEVYLFTHADLHDGVADQRFTQVFFLLLLEALNVIPCFFYKLSDDTNTTYYQSVCQEEK